MDSSFLIPIAVLAIVLIVAFLAYRGITGAASDADNPPGRDDGRPLGDTAEAHDEVSEHDLPLDHPGRQDIDRFERDAEPVEKA
jgi:hypothetical protein